MKKIKTWVKSVLPPEDRNVGWIDMSNAANPVKKVWENGGYTAITESNSSSSSADMFSIGTTPIGVAEVTSSDDSYTLGTIIDLDTFIADMKEFWPTYNTWSEECSALYELEQSTGEQQDYPDAPAIVSKYIDTTNMQNTVLCFVYETSPKGYDFSKVVLVAGAAGGSLYYCGQDLTAVQVETNKYILVVPVSEEGGSPK